MFCLFTKNNENKNLYVTLAYAGGRTNLTWTAAGAAKVGAGATDPSSNTGLSIEYEGGGERDFFMLVSLRIRLTEDFLSFNWKQKSCQYMTSTLHLNPCLMKTLIQT